MKAWAPSEWDVHARCVRTMMNIHHHSVLEDWMVALIGLIHMVSSLVDYGIHRVTIFKGRPLLEHNS